MSRHAALLDANVFYPAPMRDLLMQLAVADLIRARWTADIHREWIDALLRRDPQRDRGALEFGYLYLLGAHSYSVQAITVPLDMSDTGVAMPLPVRLLHMFISQITWRNPLWKLGMLYPFRIYDGLLFRYTDFSKILDMESVSGNRVRIGRARERW